MAPDAILISVVSMSIVSRASYKVSFEGGEEMKGAILTLLSLIILLAPTSHGQAPIYNNQMGNTNNSVSVAECKQLDNTTKQNILANLALRWKLGNPSTIKLEVGAFIEGTCYRKLTLAGGSLERQWTIFLAPDQRFVIGSLVDTTSDPSEEVRKEAKRTQELFFSQPSPETGPPNAPVTIVEFGDFECPYCKQLHEAIQGLSPEIKRRINLIYKHLPLAKHPWAHDAAMAATCADAQSSKAFWALHDFMLEEQQRLTIANFQETVNRFARTVSEIDVKQLVECMQRRKGEDIIVRDTTLAGSLFVKNTPTLFINGERVAKLPSLEELKERIADADRQINIHH
jgi:protein-disulfide isomerase